MTDIYQPGSIFDMPPEQVDAVMAHELDAVKAHDNTSQTPVYAEQANTPQRRELSRREFTRLAFLGAVSLTVVSRAVMRGDDNEPRMFDATAFNKPNSLLVPPIMDITMEAPDPTESLPEWTLAKVREVDHKIKALKPIALEVERLTGLPWEYTLTMAYRENTLDKNDSIFAGEKLGDPNPDHKGKVMPNASLLDNWVAGARYFMKGAKDIYGVKVSRDMSDADLKLAYLAWNRGNLYKWAGLSPDETPYVMNGIDEEHIGMRYPSVGKKTETLSGRQDDNIGALVMTWILRSKY